MKLSQRKLGGSTGISFEVEEGERLKELKRLILMKKAQIVQTFEMSTSDVIASMLDAEGVDTGKWKEKWEDLPEQLGKEMPEDWVPQALGDITMEEILGYEWGSKEVTGKVSRNELSRFAAMAELGDIILIRRGGVAGTIGARISQKQKERLQILGKARELWKVTDIISYLLDRAGISYGPRMAPRARCLKMLRYGVSLLEREEGFMEGSGSIRHEPAPHADALTEAGELPEHNEM